jgi:hypothetical protein
MSNELKIYHSAASPNSRQVRIFLAEKGIAIPLVPVDLAKGEQHPMPTARSIRDASCPHSFWKMALRSVRFWQLRSNRAVGTRRSVEKATGRAAPRALFLKDTFGFEMYLMV